MGLATEKTQGTSGRLLPIFLEKERDGATYGRLEETGIYSKHLGSFILGGRANDDPGCKLRSSGYWEKSYEAVMAFQARHCWLISKGSGDENVKDDSQWAQYVLEVGVADLGNDLDVGVKNEGDIMIAARPLGN